MRGYHVRAFDSSLVTDRLLASVLKMHRSNKISSYPRELC